jgi:putative membrane protein
MYRGYNGGWASGGYGFGFPWFGIVAGILFLALIGLVVYMVLRLRKIERTSAAVHVNASVPRSIEILDERFARGEIDAETYRTMKDVLETK